MTRAIIVSGGRGRAMLRYMFGRNINEDTKTLLRELCWNKSRRRSVDKQRRAKPRSEGALGLDGDMLVLRQAASRRRGRAIVDADAGCKMLSPGDGGGPGGCVHARGRRVCCGAAFYSSK